jgi:hypothetical protein
MPRAGSTVDFPNRDPFQHDHDDSAAATSRPQTDDENTSESKPSGPNSHNGEELPRDIEDIAPDIVEITGRGPRSKSTSLELQASATRPKLVKMSPTVEVHEREPSFENQTPHNENSPRVHLVTPFTMFATLIVGCSVVFVHNFYYSSLVGKVVGGSSEQQRTRLYVPSDISYVDLE